MEIYKKFVLNKSGVIQILNNKINQSQLNQQESYEEKVRKIVNAKYNELDLGMSYDQVVHILRDKQGTFVDKENNQTKVYYWAYYLNEEQNQDKEIILIAAKFINGKLTKKIITEKFMDVYNKI